MGTAPLGNLCTPQVVILNEVKNPEKTKHRDPFATAAFASG